MVPESLQSARDTLPYPIVLSEAAAELACDIAWREGELRRLGANAARIAQIRGREFGAKKALLAMNDPSAQFIYRPESEVVHTAEPSALSKWAQRTHRLNLQTTASEYGDERSRAFKDS